MANDAPDLPAPSAEGALARTPLPHLLIYAHDRQLTGTMELATPAGDEVASILFIDGQPSKVRTAEPVAYLGRVLLELGFISESALNFSLRKLAEQKKLHGQILLAAGSIKQEQLLEGLRVQMQRKLRALVQLPPETVFRYYDGFDALHRFGGDDLVGLDPYPLVWGFIREAPPWDHVHAALSRIGTATLRIGDGAAIARFGFDAGEAALVKLLGGRGLRMHELAQASKVGPRVTQLFAYCLLATKQVELVTDAQPTGQADSSVAIVEPPPSSKRSLPTEPPLSPASQAVARLHLQPQALAATRAVIEARVASNPSAAQPDERKEPRPTPFAAVTTDRYAQPPIVTKGTPAVPVGSEQVLLPRAPPLGDPVYTKPTTPSMGAVRERELAPKLSPPAAAAPPEPPASREPASGDDDATERRKQIVWRAEHIEGENYFEMLELDTDATGEQVSAAYLKLAKAWHPDRLPAALADVKDKCARVFAHLSEANQTLADPLKRRRYMNLLKEGGATPESQAKIAAVVGAATDFQKAEILLKRNDLAQAELHCRKAVEADPERAEYHALLAWLEAQKPDKRSPAATEELIGRLSRAIEKSPKCERALFYRGMLHKRLGQDAAAVRDFRRAAELNPRNIDAQREVRVFEMRRGQSLAPHAKKKEEDKGGSLFGKLFKK